MFETRLSVIVPVYNKKKFVKRCLDSIAEQKRDDVQIIIVDDGSTDGSEKICDKYKAQGFEVYHIEHGGVSKARNFGLGKVTGEYVTFLDADDAYAEEALPIMVKITERGFRIVQFGQYRLPTEESEMVKDANAKKGHYTIANKLPKHWAMVWNKMYHISLIRDNKIKFKEGMQFGEDELFNIECILITEGFYHAPQTLIRHYFDDENSLCRGELDKERMDNMLRAIEKVKERPNLTSLQSDWLDRVLKAHKTSAIYRKLKRTKKPNGKYDIVYFIKEAPENEELRYSLRSVEENWQYNDIWFYGGCPRGIYPDHYVKVQQTEYTKWRKVRSMLYKACKNDEITEDFWLFNDDFYILKPITEDMPPQYNGDLYKIIVQVEERHGQKATAWTKQLRHLVHTLEDAGKGCLNYAVHKPILINRKKMIEVLDKFPEEPMSRALYGNYWEIGGVSKHDMKIAVDNYNLNKIKDWEFLSTQDTSFKQGNIGVFIREKFNKPSRFEEEK